MVSGKKNQLCITELLRMVSEAKLCDSCMCCLLDVTQDKSFWWTEGDSFSRKEQEFMLGSVCMRAGSTSFPGTGVLMWMSKNLVAV